MSEMTNEQAREAILKAWGTQKQFSSRAFTVWVAETSRELGVQPYPFWAAWEKVKREGLFVRATGYGPTTTYVSCPGPRMRPASLGKRARELLLRIQAKRPPGEPPWEVTDEDRERWILEELVDVRRQTILEVTLRLSPQIALLVDRMMKEKRA